MAVNAATPTSPQVCIITQLKSKTVMPADNSDNPSDEPLYVISPNSLKEKCPFLRLTRLFFLSRVGAMTANPLVNAMPVANPDPAVDHPNAPTKRIFKSRLSKTVPPSTSMAK